MSIVEKNHENDLINKIKELQESYYSKNKKNLFFKKNQKLECATEVCSAFPLEYLISQTIYAIQNKIFIDYTIFKLFANKNNFNEFVDKVFIILEQSFKSFENFELYINLESFTVTALERYKEVIKEFIDKCHLYNTRYSDNIINLYICNVPNTFDAIIKAIKPFMEKQVFEKINLCDNITSEKTIAEFHSFRDSMTS
jgi:hypothetical protein